MQPIQISLCHWANHCREYMAKITGIDPNFGLARDFLRPESRKWSRSGKQGITHFLITEPGYYEIQEPRTGVYGGKGARRWFRLEESGEVTAISEQEVYAAFGVELAEPRTVEI